MTSPKIPEGLQVFLRHAESLHPSNNVRRENGFAKEFQQLKDMSSKLKKDSEYTTHHGELDHNRPKNRYKDILPFDYNRIMLPTLPGIPGSDYINGNYVKGPDGKTAYLALQGPLPRTVDDFWRLIASHRCQIVIMVCREIEMGKLKCKRYWPESKDEILTFAGLEISLISEDNIAEGFVMRTMCMKSDKEEMTVTQLQYTAWPDHDVPKSATPLIELNRTLRAIQGNRKQVALIHCSAGCGRTGTICAVDYAWTLLKMQKTSGFSVYDIVASLRRQRMAMVQTKEQYALVYKAVVQLVQEELDKERLKSHTYVNVEIPAASNSPTGHGNYENCEFLNSVSRWKQNDLQNGSVRKALAPLPAPVPKETKTNSKVQPQPANRKPVPRSKPDEAAPLKPNVPTKSVDYVNLEFTQEASKNIPASAVKDALPDGTNSTQPKSPTKANVPSLNFNEVKGDTKGSGAVRQKSPTAPDYEVLPKRTSVSAAASSGNEKPPQKNKVVSADYEFPSMCAPQKQSKEVPEAKPKPKPELSGLRSNSSPNVLDDSWVFGPQRAISNSPPGVHPDSSKEKADSRAFHTVPNRIHPDSGPKRCPLTAELFQDPGASGGGAVAGGGGGGFGVMQPSQVQYCLVGAAGSPSPPKVMAKPQFVPQQNQGSQLQKQRLPVEGGNSPQPKKQGEQPKSKAPVGAYSLVGIPEVPGQSPVLFSQSTASTPVTVKSDPSKTNAGSPVESKAKPITGVAVEIKGSPIVEPSYELVGHWQQPTKKVSPPSVRPYKPRNAGPANLDATKGAREVARGSPLLPNKVDKQKPVAESETISDASQRGQADGAPKDASNVTVAPDLYAVVVPRSDRENTDRNSANLSGGSPNIRPQSSTGSLRSVTSTSSDEGEAPPRIPEKTNEAFLVPGEEPYENVIQSSRGTLDRFRKMIKSTSKGTLPKRQADSSIQQVQPRTNSLKNVTLTTRLEEIGYKKRLAKPIGPRPCPAEWPSFGHFGL